MGKSLYIVRHGQTDWNVRQLRQGRTDIELNETGIEQALELRDKLKSVKIDVCYVSPLKRAMKTAQIICEDRVPIIREELLTEKCFGKTEGMEQEYLPYAEDFRFGNTYDDNTETWEELLARAEKVLAKLRATEEQDILVVSHGVFLKALYYTVIGYDTNTDFMSWAPKNCEVKKLEV